jgi:DNA repair exonuclease SbcCD ATPase subunit
MNTQKITLKRLTLRNFKGIRKFEFCPNAGITEVLGANKSGKTTLAVAFIWLLWGKDLEDRKDYQIKTLDSNNNSIPQLEHEVSAVIDNNGQEITLKRIYQEKWIKTRGESESKMQGHETTLYWNDVELKLSDYTKKVVEIFQGEQTFKILTNPLFFNEGIKWEDRRDILTRISGNVSEQEILYKNPKFQDLLDKLTGKSLKEFETQVKQQKNHIKDQLEIIPVRLDENQRQTPVEPDYKQIQAELDIIQIDIENTDRQLRDSSEAKKGLYLKKEEYYKNLNATRAKIVTFENQAREKSQKDQNEHFRKEYELKSKIANIDRDIKLLDESIAGNIRLIETYKEQQETLRQAFRDENARELIFDESKFSCPTCNREFEPGDIESKKAEMIALFNTNKSMNLTTNREKGKALGIKIEDLYVENGKKELEKAGKEQELGILQDELTELQSNAVSITPIESILSENQDYQVIKVQFDQLSQNPIDDSTQDNSELEAKKRELTAKADLLKAHFSVKKTVSELKARREEILSEQKKLTQELSDWNKYDLLIENFNREKAASTEEKVNKFFPTVKFKMFENQINGGLKEICETLIQNEETGSLVPFPAANDAAKIQAGIEIINVLSSHFGISLPIFNDNAESVTKIPETSAQIIRLFVDPEYKELTIKSYDKI